MDLVTLAVILIVVVLILVVFGKKIGKSPVIEQGIYTQRGALFTVAERSFYGVLEQAISKDYKIFGKVRVADVLTPKPSLDKSNWQTAFNKISAKHFDYVLCQKDTLQVIAVIELDDKSHNSKKAKNRDDFIEDACQGADLKLIRFKAKTGYQIDSVREFIVGSITKNEGDLVNAPELNVVVVDKKDNELPSRLNTNEKNKISTSKMAKKLGVKTPYLLNVMVEIRYLMISDGIHHLTEKGEKLGGEFIEKSRLPAHFIWPEDLEIS
jgi:hypothetical protein